jgi:hypothetical protein
VKQVRQTNTLAHDDWHFANACDANTLLYELNCFFFSSFIDLKPPLSGRCVCIESVLVMHHRIEEDCLLNEETVGEGERSLHRRALNSIGAPSYCDFSRRYKNALQRRKFPIANLTSINVTGGALIWTNLQLIKGCNWGSSLSLI